MTLIRREYSLLRKSFRRFWGSLISSGGQVLGVVFLAILVVDFYFAYQVIGKELGSNRPDIPGIMQVLAPLTLGLGVFVAWLTLVNNQKHKSADTSRETSSFFFHECTRKLEKVVAILASREQGDLWQHGIKTSLGESAWKEIARELRDTRLLWKNISHDAYRDAFRLRWSDIEHELASELRSMSMQDYVQLSWGGELPTILERVESYNAGLAKHTEDLSEEQYIERLKQAGGRDEDTPFPSGLSSRTMREILLDLACPPTELVSHDREEIVERYIADRQLNVLGEYLDTCKAYYNDRGFIRKRS